MNFFKWLIPKPKPRIELIKFDDGFYAVKAYGFYLTSTVTRDEIEAKQFLEAVIKFAEK